MTKEESGCRVYSEVRVYFPVPDVPYAMLGFTFGHERYAKNDTQEEIRRTANLMDEFNQREVEKRTKSYLRDLRRVNEETIAESEGNAVAPKAGKKNKKSKSVKERVKERM